MKKPMLAALLLPLLLLTGCAPRAERSVFAMDTYMTLACTGTGADTALDACIAEITRLDGLFSVTDAGSDVYALNHADGAALGVSPDTAALLQAAKAASARTDGAFDPTVYPLVGLWGFLTDTPAVPDADMIAARRALVDYRNLSVDGETAQLLHGAQIDLGGIAKGYCGQQVCALLRSRGIKSALITLGGNVQCVGSRPDGSPWRVGVRDPADPEGLVGILSLTDAAAVTSGGYQRCFEEDGVVYHHILDPQTGRPADSDLSSVTIVCSDGTLADALSTALFVMGFDRAVRFWRASDDFQAVFVTSDGVVYTTDELLFTPSDGKECRKLSKIF